MTQNRLKSSLYSDCPVFPLFLGGVRSFGRKGTGSKSALHGMDSA
jgi:hypothetical protein